MRSMPSLKHLLPLLPAFLTFTLTHAQSDTATITSAPDAAPSSSDDSGSTDSNNIVVINGSTVSGGDSGGTTIDTTISNNNIDDGATSCPGALVNTVSDGTSSAYCCVGGSAIVSTCPGWPICTGPGTTTGGVDGCKTTIDVAATNYSELVSSVEASLSGSANGADSSSASEAASSASDAGGSASSSASASASRTSASAAAAAGTNMVLPMGVVAGGLLGLAAFL